MAGVDTPSVVGQVGFPPRRGAAEKLPERENLRVSGSSSFSSSASSQEDEATAARKDSAVRTSASRVSSISTKARQISSTRSSKTRQSNARQSKTRQSKTRQSKTRQSKTRQSKARSSKRQLAQRDTRAERPESYVEPPLPEQYDEDEPPPPPYEAWESDEYSSSSDSSDGEAAFAMRNVSLARRGRTMSLYKNMLVNDSRRAPPAGSSGYYMHAQGGNWSGDEQDNDPIEKLKFVVAGGNLMLSAKDVVRSVSARVQLSNGWIELDTFTSEEDGAVTGRCQARPGVEMRLEANGHIWACVSDQDELDLSSDQDFEDFELDADQTILQAHLTFEEADFKSEFTHGHSAEAYNSSHLIKRSDSRRAIHSLQKSLGRAVKGRSRGNGTGVRNSSGGGGGGHGVGVVGSGSSTAHNYTSSGKFRPTGVESHGMVLLENSSKSQFLLLGGSTCQSGTTSFWSTAEKGGRVAVTYVLSFGYPGILGAGGERLVMFLGDDSQTLLEAFAQDCAAFQDKNKGDKELALHSHLRDLGSAPVGWGTWDEFGTGVTSSDVDEMLAAVQRDSELKSTLNVITLDDGYQTHAGDWLDTHPDFGLNSSEGLASVAARVRKQGLTPGIWIAPFLASKTSRIFKEHPEWFLRRTDKPSKFVVGRLSRDRAKGTLDGSKKPARPVPWYVLDTSNGEVLDHLEGVFRMLSKQSWRFFKLDYLGAGMREGIRYNGEGMTRVEAYIAGIKAVRRGMGPRGFMLGVAAPLMASAQSGCFDAMRVTRDGTAASGARKSAKQLTRKRSGTVARIGRGLGAWASTIGRAGNPDHASLALWGAMSRWFMHGTLWKFNDPGRFILPNGNSGTKGLSRNGSRAMISMVKGGEGFRGVSGDKRAHSSSVSDGLTIDTSRQAAVSPAILTQLTVLGLTGGLFFLGSNLENAIGLDADHRHTLFGVLPLTSLRGRPSPFYNPAIAEARHGPSVLELGDLEDNDNDCVAAVVNWTSATQVAEAPRDGWDFWNQRFVHRGEHLDLAPNETVALQCARRSSLLVGTSFHISAIADGRIVSDDSPDGLRCRVGGTGHLMRKQGILLFRASVVQVNLAEGARVLHESVSVPSGIAACEILVTMPDWFLDITILSYTIAEL